MRRTVTAATAKSIIQTSKNRLIHTSASPVMECLAIGSCGELTCTGNID